jgi:hypothetical protein
MSHRSILLATVCWLSLEPAIAREMFRTMPEKFQGTWYNMDTGKGTVVISDREILSDDDDDDLGLGDKCEFTSISRDEILTAEHCLAEFGVLCPAIIEVEMNCSPHQKQMQWALTTLGRSETKILNAYEPETERFVRYVPLKTE